MLYINSGKLERGVEHKYLLGLQKYKAYGVWVFINENGKKKKKKCAREMRSAMVEVDGMAFSGAIANC